MRIVALDIATKTGVAVGEPNSQPISWTVDLGKASEDERFSRILALTDKLLRERKPDLVVVEAAIGGPKASHFLIGLVACVRGCCANRKVPVEQVWLGSIRRHFIGKDLGVKDFPGMSKAAAKRAIKETVISRCRMLGWNPEDDNAADALALLDYALANNTNHQARVAGGLF